MYCLASFCCVCLNDSAKLQHINDLDIDGLPLLNKLIFVSFGNEAIDLTVIKYICSECKLVLRIAHAFKKSCIVNHELVRIYNGQLKYYTGKVSDYKDLLIPVEQLPEPKNNAKNALTDNTESTAKRATSSPSEKKKVYVPAKKNYKTISLLTLPCSICSKQLSSYNLLKRHLLTHSQSPKLDCTACDTKLSNLTTLKKHVFLKHAVRKTFTCLVCKLILPNELELRKHMNFIHLSIISCKYCKKQYRNNLELQRHIVANHKVCICSICNKEFRSKRKMLSHKRTHKTDHLETHIPHVNKTITGRKKCRYCLCIFSTGLALKKHKCFRIKNKKCITSDLTESGINTPELQESEKTNENNLECVAATAEEQIPSQIKDEIDIEVKEEMLDDFMYMYSGQLNDNTGKSIGIDDVFNGNEFTDIPVESMQEEKYDLVVNLDKTFEIQTINDDESNVPLTNTQPNIELSEKIGDNVQINKKRSKIVSKRKSIFVDRSPQKELNEMRATNEELDENKEESSNIPIKKSKASKNILKLRRKSISVEVPVNTENIVEPEIKIRSRRKNITVTSESVETEKNIEPINTKGKISTIKSRRKSVWGVNTVTKSSSTTNESAENKSQKESEPIILKFSFSSKKRHTKSHRKRDCDLDSNMESTEPNENVPFNSDTTENITEHPNISEPIILKQPKLKMTNNSDSKPKPQVFQSSTTNTFKRISLRRKSVYYDDDYNVTQEQKD